MREDSSFPDIVTPWTKDYFYSLGLGEFWEVAVQKGKEILEEELNG